MDTNFLKFILLIVEVFDFIERFTENVLFFRLNVIDCIRYYRVMMETTLNFIFFRYRWKIKLWPMSIYLFSLPPNLGLSLVFFFRAEDKLMNIKS